MWVLDIRVVAGVLGLSSVFLCAVRDVGVVGVDMVEAERTRLALMRFDPSRATRAS